jgi:hypothetical protein
VRKLPARRDARLFLGGQPVSTFGDLHSRRELWLIYGAGATAGAALSTVVDRRNLVVVTASVTACCGVWLASRQSGQLEARAAPA